jgi:putative SOS response-associated peptidase YedK
MCGRLNVIEAPIVAFLAEFLGEVPFVESRGNVAPTEPVLALRAETSGYNAALMRWWLVPHWSTGPQHKFSMFNARAETLASSPAYRDPFKTRRCVVPASGYFEWRKQNGQSQPMYFEAENGEALLFAGLWDEWRGPDGLLTSCTIVTTSAPTTTKAYHHRLPMMLTVDEVATWIDPATAKDHLTQMMTPRLPSALTVVDLSPAVNNAREKDLAAQIKVSAPIVLPAS